jgi:hypothetical protein
MQNNTEDLSKLDLLIKKCNESVKYDPQIGKVFLSLKCYIIELEERIKKLEDDRLSKI